MHSKVSPSPPEKKCLQCQGKTPLQNPRPSSGKASVVRTKVTQHIRRRRSYIQSTMHIQRPNSPPTNKIWAQSKSNETPWSSIFLKQSLPRTHTFSSQTTKSPSDVLSNCYSLSFNCDQPKPESRFSFLKTQNNETRTVPWKNRPITHTSNFATRLAGCQSFLFRNRTKRKQNSIIEGDSSTPEELEKTKKIAQNKPKHNNKLLSSTTSSYNNRVFSSVLRSECSPCCCGCEEKWDRRRTNPREQQQRSGSTPHHWQWRSRLGCQTGLLPARREHVRRAGPERGPSAKPQPSEGN